MNDSNPLTDEIRQAGKPKLKLNLPPRPEVPDAAIETSSRQIGEKWGAATQLAAPPPIEPEEPTAPLVSVRFDCPNYVDKAVSVNAAEQGVTKTFLILKALKLAGYDIRDVDLVGDRRKARKR
jgi:hypothetical protein